jgi:hypothetical protein
MATRTIVTSQPDVACDVCARRLLRGEQPDVFVGAGRRMIVCELCAPRATHEGWMRESDSQQLSLPPARARRGRSLFERLPVPFKVRPSDGRTRVDDRAAGDAAWAPVPAEPVPVELVPVELVPVEPVPVELVPGEASADIEPVAAWPAAAEHEAAWPAAAEHEAAWPAAAEHAQPARAGASETHAAHEQQRSYAQEAIAVFNASEFPRRVAGVARSLGAPSVSVRSAEHLVSVVRIVVAWELCWYRYEVDLSESHVEAQVIAQGSELSELAREDRRGNAVAHESGALALAA